MQKIGTRDNTFRPWAGTWRWLLAVLMAALPFVIAPIALMILRTFLLTLGVSMYDIAYFFAAGSSAYLSVMWSTSAAPRQQWRIGRGLSVTYWLASIAALVAVLLLDQHPFNAMDENEMLEILVLGGLGMGALGGYAWVTGTRRAGA